MGHQGAPGGRGRSAQEEARRPPGPSPACPGARGGARLPRPEEQPAPPPAEPPAAVQGPPPSSSARHPPLQLGTSAAGSHLLVFLGAEDGGQVLRHFPPAAAAADTAADADDPARRPPETSPGRDDARSASPAWRHCPIRRGAACAWAGLGARGRCCPGGRGARAPPASATYRLSLGSPGWRQRSPSPGLGPGDLHRRSPMPREAKRLQRRQRPRGFSTKSLGPGPERASLALGVPRAVSGARSPSPHFPWGFPTEPLLREDAFFSFLVFGEQSRSSPAPRSGGVPPGPGPGKARRVWRGSDAGKAERTSSGRAHWPARQSGARE